MADHSVHEEIQALKEDLALLRSDMADLTSTMRDTARARARGVKSSVNDEIHELRERLRDRMEQARVQGMRSVEEVEESIGQHPLASVAAAVGVGFIIAKLMDLGRR